MDPIAKAKDLIARILDKIDDMPITWREFVGEELADEIDEFLGNTEDQDDDEEWEEIDADDEDVYGPAEND